MHYVMIRFSSGSSSAFTVSPRGAGYIRVDRNLSYHAIPWEQYRENQVECFGGDAMARNHILKPLLPLVIVVIASCRRRGIHVSCNSNHANANGTSSMLDQTESIALRARYESRQ